MKKGKNKPTEAVRFFVVVVVRLLLFFNSNRMTEDRGLCEMVGVGMGETNGSESTGLIE